GRAPVQRRGPRALAALACRRPQRGPPAGRRERRGADRDRRPLRPEEGLRRAGARHGDPARPRHADARGADRRRRGAPPGPGPRPVAQTRSLGALSRRRDACPRDARRPPGRDRGPAVRRLRWPGSSPGPASPPEPQPDSRSLPVRIALLCSDLGIPFGGVKGASVHLRAVAGSLLRMGHQVSAIVANTGPEPGYTPLTERGLELRVLRQPRTVREVDWHLSQVQPQLVIERLTLLAPEGALAAAEAGVPHIYEVNAPLDEEAARHRKFERIDEALQAF